MRILHLDTGREMRGGQHQAFLLMRMLRDAGHDNCLLARADSPLLDAARREKFEAGWIQWQAVRTCSRNADVVHCHDARAHTLAAIWSKAPFVVARRVVFPVKAGMLSRWKYGRAAHFIAVSQCVRRMLMEVGIETSRISVVPDAVELPDVQSDYSGGLLALASDDAGKGGELLRATGLEIDFMRELSAGLAHARVFLYASTSEGLGSAALLAHSYGVPVVASRVGGLQEAVEDGVTGILVENQPQEFAAAARRLLEQPDLAARMGAAGRRRVIEHFSPARMLEGTLAAYNQVIA